MLLLDNGLHVSVDWISFTVLSSSTVDEVIEFMGFDPIFFKDMPNGSNGYKCMKKYENISVLFDGADNMGIHVNITGSSIGLLLDAYKESLSLESPFGKAYDLWDDVLSHFLLQVLNIGQLSRLDVAIDDVGANYYSLDDIRSYCEKGRIVSKWKTFDSYSRKRISDCEKVGDTLYFGSRKSSCYLRIYDKKLERNSGLNPSDKDYVSMDWVRWELEFHKERAVAVARQLSNGQLLSDVVMGVLLNYFRIIRLDDVNKSRCSVDEKWLRFVGDVCKLRITVEKEQKDFDERLEQFVKQHGRELAFFLMGSGGDLSFFGDIAMRYECKLTPVDRLQLQQLGVYE